MSSIQNDYLTDHHGRVVPKESIKPTDLLRDQFVRDSVEKALECSAHMDQVFQQIMRECDNFMEFSAQNYDIKPGKAKNNITFYSYDRQYKIAISYAERLVFDERLQIARTLIDDLLKQWTTDSRMEIKTLINEAFESDKEGKINKTKILALRKHNFQDERWQKAMEAIADATQIIDTKRYIRFYKRTADGAYTKINFSPAGFISHAED